MAIASGLDLARLAIVFDTTTAPAAIAAMQSVVATSKNVGAAADQTAVKLANESKAVKETAAAFSQLNTAHAAAASGYKRGTVEGQAYTRTVQGMKAALDAEARAAAAVASGHQQRAAAIGRLMTASQQEYQKGAISAQQYATRLQQLQVEMNKLAGAQTAVAASGKAATHQMALLGGAFGGFFAILGFQGLAAITQFAGFIGGLPGDLAHAGDEFMRFNARVTFAFRGSAEAARLARRDIIEIARTTGVPYSQVAQGYGDLAIAGRGPGLSREQITGLSRAFPTLAAMTGSDNASTARAMWQFQQALALGRLTYQDYRFMATNMPAIDDALAAGMMSPDGSIGVDVNRIPMMISRGEISAERMVDALGRGVEILRESAGGLPETMERARGRIQTEWQLLLHGMEEAIKSSEFYQSFMGGVAGNIQGWRMLGARGSRDPNVLQERIDWLEGFRDANPYAFQQFGGQREIDRMRAIVNSPENVDRASGRSAAEAARELGAGRRADINRGIGAVNDLDPITAQTSDLTDLRNRLQGALDQRQALSEQAIRDLYREDSRLALEQDAIMARAGRPAEGTRAHDVVLNSPDYRAAATTRNALQEQIRGAGALEAEQVRQFEQALAGVDAQIANLMYAFDRMSLEANQAFADLTQYGAGAGFEMAQAARGIMAQARAQNRPVSQEAAMALEFRRRLIGADNQTGMGMADLDLIVRHLLPQAGRGEEARRLADVEYQVSRFAQTFGPFAETAAAQQRIAAERARIERDSVTRAQMSEGDRLGENAVSLDAERRRLTALGNPAALRGIERQLQREALQRQYGERAAPHLAQAEQGFALQDERTIAERRTADQERLRALRAQLDIGVQLGQGGRIALAQLEREQELRRLGLAENRKLVEAERARVAENVRVSEQLDLQNEQMRLLQDSARLAGQALGDALSAGIVAGIRSGKDGAEAALNALARSGERILSNLLSRATAPFERRLEEMAAGRLQGWFGRGDGGEGPDAAMSALGEAAEGAAENIMGAMVPSITEAGAKIAVSTTATASEASARAAATLATQSFTGAVLAAANAAHIFAASAAASGGADFASSVVKALPGFASGVRNFSGGLAIVGEEGPELVRLPRGADVYSHGQSKAMLGAGETNVQVNIIDQRGAGAGAVETRESRGPNGERILDVLVTEKVNQGIKKGAFNSALGAQFGMTPQIRKA